MRNVIPECIFIVLLSVCSVPLICVAATEKSRACVAAATDLVDKMWKNNSYQIPQHYIDMVNDTANRKVMVHTRGKCNGKNFVCEMGAVRSSCDPCAFTKARQAAIEKHTADMVQANCGIHL